MRPLLLVEDIWRHAGLSRSTNKYAARLLHSQIVDDHFSLPAEHIDNARQSGRINADAACFRPAPPYGNFSYR